MMKPFLRPTFPALCLATLAGCTQDGAVRFTEGARAAGLVMQHTDGSSGKYYIVETLASGVILFDFNLDGALDVYLPNGRPLPPTPEGNQRFSNALFANDGKGKLTNVTREKGVPGTGFGTGGAAGDHDGDGDLDLYVCQYGPNVLYRNNGKEGGWTFTDVTREAGCDDARFSAGACFFDLENDGDLDLYVTNYCIDDLKTSDPFWEGKSPRYHAPSHYKAEGHSLFKNKGDGTFEDVTESSGASNVSEPGRGMGVMATDINADGLLDLYVANDGTANFLFKNLGGGKLEEVGMASGTALSSDGSEMGSMGVDAGDADRDGTFEIIVTNFQKQLNNLYRPVRPGFYTDTAMAQGLGETCLPMVSWGVKLFDYDHDGWLDIFIANGHLEDHIHEYDQSTSFLQQNQLFHNEGKGVFKEVSSSAGPGLQEKKSSRGAAFGDLDNDGDIDIVVCNSRDAPSLLWNEGGNRRSWVLLELSGIKNKFAVGAFVRVTAGGVTQSGEVRAGSSYISQNDLRLHFGLGDAETVDRVEVDWPGGKKEAFSSLPARRIHRLTEGTGTPR